MNDSILLPQHRTLTIPGPIEVSLVDGPVIGTAQSAEITFNGPVESAGTSDAAPVQFPSAAILTALPSNAVDRRDVTDTARAVRRADKRRRSGIVGLLPAGTHTGKMGHSTGRNQPCPCGSGKKYKNCHRNENRG